MEIPVTRPPPEPSDQPKLRDAGPLATVLPQSESPSLDVSPPAIAIGSPLTEPPRTYARGDSVKKEEERGARLCKLGAQFDFGIWVKRNQGQILLGPVQDMIGDFRLANTLSPNNAPSFVRILPIDLAMFNGEILSARCISLLYQ